MVARHGASARAFLAGFAEHVVVDVAGLGSVRLCHGSPRSDEELVTPATPEARVRAFMEGVPERVLVTAHTHLQFVRTIAGIRSLNAGSVGMPYAERTGAYWALLGPDVDLRCTDYDLDEAARRYRATDDPLREEMVSIALLPTDSGRAHRAGGVARALGLRLRRRAERPVTRNVPEDNLAGGRDS
jgi:hypothetical protein